MAHPVLFNGVNEALFDFLLAYNGTELHLVQNSEIVLRLAYCVLRFFNYDKKRTPKSNIQLHL